MVYVRIFYDFSLSVERRNLYNKKSWVKNDCNVIIIIIIIIIYFKRIASKILMLLQKIVIVLVQGSLTIINYNVKTKRKNNIDVYQTSYPALLTLRNYSH